MTYKYDHLFMIESRKRKFYLESIIVKNIRMKSLSFCCSIFFVQKNLHIYKIAFNNLHNLAIFSI